MTLLVVCALGTVHATRNIYWGIQSTQWPSVDGEVFQSFLRGGFGLPYWPVVRYEYQSGGRRFRKSRIIFGHLRISSKVSAQAFLRQFRTGASVTIRMHPSRPGLSVLRPGNPFANWIELVAGFFMGLYIAYGVFPAV